MEVRGGIESNDSLFQICDHVATQNLVVPVELEELTLTPAINSGVMASRESATEFIYPNLYRFENEGTQARRGNIA